MITYREHRGDRYLTLSAQREGKQLGYAITISWAPSNSGAMFARNFKAATVYVTVSKDAPTADQPDVVLFKAEAGRATYQRDAYRLARAFIRENNLKALIEKDLTSPS